MNSIKKQAMIAMIAIVKKMKCNLEKTLVRPNRDNPVLDPLAVLHLDN